MVKASGGDRWRHRMDAVRTALEEAKAVDVGFMPGAKYPDGTPVALVAAVQNFGAPSRGIPPRPFFTEMIRERSGEWPQAIKEFLKVGDFNTKDALEHMGELIKGELQQKINTFQGVPLAAATIKKKGFDKQLVDTSHMINSVDYQVVK